MVSVTIDLPEASINEVHVLYSIMKIYYCTCFYRVYTLPYGNDGYRLHAPLSRPYFFDSGYLPVLALPETLISSQSSATET